MSDGWWELIFLMFVMKIPILYLIGVVWWAVRAQPDPYEPAALVPVAETDPPPAHPARACPWRGRHPRPRPHAPVRAHRRVALARAVR
jgi:hypothetical protein